MNHAQHPPETTTSNPSLSVARIPEHLQEQLYTLTIILDLDDEIFAGDLFFLFVCLNDTNKMFLRMTDLIIDNSSIRIVNSLSTSIPMFPSWSYDDYNELIILNISSSFVQEHSYTIHMIYKGDITRDLHGLYLSDYVDVNGENQVFLTSQMEPKSDFACRSERLIDSKNIRSRISRRVDILPQFAYADETSVKVMEFFNQYFDLDYPLRKIEHFAVLDFDGGAVENYGLLMRKLYHLQENKISPAWWGQLWLKEGFANYMKTLASRFVEPLRQIEEQFVVDKVFDFMEADSFSTSRPLSLQSTDPADIFQLYDSISYYKGATLIRMMSMFLGAETFQRAVQMYLKAFQFSSATEEDLWRYFSVATNNTIDIGRIMKNG